MKILLPLLRRVSLTSLLIISTFFAAQASHNVGCTITYTCLGPGVGGNQYLFRMVCYRDCSGISMPTSDVISFTNNGTCAGAVANLTLNSIPALSGIDQSQVCDPTSSACQGGALPGTEQWVYEGTTTLPAGCIWTVSYQTCCRGGTVTNLQNASSAGTYVSTTVNTNIANCNNSVQFSNIPIIYTCDSTLTYYNHGASDPDGDTLVFTLVTPQNSPPANLPYAAGLTALNPLFLVPTTIFGFDATTGQMTFRPQDNLGQVAMIAVRVDEIRNGVVIASTVREVQVVVLTNCDNDPPAVDSNGVQGSAIAISGSDLELCRGNFAQFQLVIEDPNGDNLIVTSNIITAIPGAVVSYNVNSTVPDSVILTFTVNSINLTPGIYPFTINVEDDACPVPAIQFLGYALRVYGANYTSNVYCRNDTDPVPIIVGDSSGIFAQLPTNPPGLVMDSITGIIDLSASAVGTYDIVYTYDTLTICPSDSITITIVDIPNPTFSYPRVLWCRQGVDPAPTISGTPGGAFSGDAGLVINPITGVIDISATTLGTHNIYYDVIGGTCAARDTFTINVMQMANFAASSSLYFICPVPTTIQLNTAVSYNGTAPPPGTYLWTPNISITNVNIPNPQVTLSGPQTYYLTYNDGHCPTMRDTIEISVPYPANILPTSDVVLCNGSSAQITAAVAAGPGNQGFTSSGSSVIVVEDTSYATINVSGVAPSIMNATLVAAMQMCMTLNVNAIGHLKVFLIAPSGQIVQITNRHGGTASVLTNATFSTNPSNLSLAPYVFPFPAMPANSFFLPMGGLTGFNGLIGATTNGTWRLMIVHSNGGLSTINGSVVNWCLNFADLSAASFVWSPNTNISCTSCTSPTINPPVNTTYRVIATNLFGCKDTAYVNAVIDSALPKPIVTCGNATSNSVTFHWIPVFGAAGYVATVNGGAPVNVPAAQDSFVVNGLSVGQCVTFTLFAESANTCDDGQPDTAVCCAANCGIIDPLNITPSGSTTFCIGQSVGLDAGAGFVGYLWSTGETTRNIVASTSQLISVTTTDNNGCLDTGSIVITVTPGPTPNITASGSTTLCAGQSVTLDAGAGYTAYSWNPIAATRTISANTSATYIVTVTDAIGCIGVDSMLVTVGTPLTVNMSFHDISCNGVVPPNGDAGATPIGSFGGYTYLWSNTRTTATISGLGVGTYCVTITDVNSCTVSGCVTISEPSAITLSTAQTNVSCFNGTDGTATVTPSGGTGTFTYSWSNGQTNATATGLAAGQRCVTVTDASGCTASVCVTITQPAVTVTSSATITSNYSGSPISCGGTCDGVATGAGFGGTPGYSFVWTNGQTTSVATGLCVGVASVTVTDAAGCSSISSVTLTQPSPITVTVNSVTNPSCNGGTNGQAQITATGGASGYTYSWNTVPAQTTATATGLASGPYTVIVTDANGCTGTNSVTLTNPSAVSVTTSVTSNYNGAQVSCNGICNGQITATSSGGTGAYSFIWSNGQISNPATGLCAGAHTVTVSDASGCVAVSSITITEPTAVTASSVSTNALCNGASNGTATASGGGGMGGYTFVWNTTPAQSTAIATGLNASTGVYTATVSDVNGCSDITSVTITQPTPVVATVSSTPVSCNGGNDGTGFIVSVGGGTPGTPNYTFNWGNGPTAATTSPAQFAGVHTVTITDGNGCSITENYTVTEPSAMSFTIASTAATCNGYADGTATINVSGGVGGFVYSWNNTQTTATATGLVAGVYCVTATDGNGCIVNTCVTVTEPSGFSNMNFTAINVSCFGGSNGQLTVSISGAIQPYTYLWSNGQTGNTATGLNATTHSVTISDANSCTVSGNAVVTQPTQLQLNFDVDSVTCKNGSDGQIQALVTGGTFPYTYLWNTNPLQNTATATGLDIGNYTVTVTDFNGCKIIGTATVYEPLTALTAQIINQTNPSCNNSCDGIIEVDAQGATPNYTFQWSNGQNTSIATGVCAGVHRVTITDANGCSTTASGILTQPSAIILNPSILSNYNGSPITCPGAADGSVGVVAAGGNGGFSYIWSPNGQNTANINGLVEGTYCVTVTDVRGCKADTCITINDPTPLQANFTQVNILCHGDANGQILVNAVTGTGTIGINGYEYKLTGPGQVGNVYSNVNAYSNLVAGAYTIFVRDGNDCEIQIPVQITEPAEVVVTAVNVTNALCYGSATGTATAVVTGGTGAYTYIWSNSQTTNPATGLALGLYTVTVADANGCNKVETFNVGQAPELIGSVTATPVACLGGVTTATATASGGTPINLNSYLYRWTNGTTNATAVNLSAGVHCVTITDANACTIVECVTITEPATAVSATISSQTAALCQGTATGTATAQGVGGTAPYTYVWQTLPNQSTQTATGLQTGIYAVVVTDDNGCTSQTNVTITEPNSVSVSIVGIGGATCNGLANGTATAVGAGGVGGFTYNWNNGETTATATGLAAGNNTVTITDANGCSTTAIAVITQPTAVEITNLSTTDVACFGDATGTAALSVQGGTPTNGYIYNWSSGVSQNGVTVSGLSAGSHTVTVTDANGCYDIDTFVINQPATGLTGYLTGTPALCFGTSSGQMGAVVQGGTPYPNGSYVYEWNTTPAQSTVVADSIPAGTYTVTVTDFNTCSIVLTGTIGQAPQLNITATVQQPVTCNGGNNGIAIATTATGGTPGYTYVWTDAAGQVGQVATGLSAGVVSVVVTDANGCSASAAVTVTEGAPIALNANITNVSCHGGNNGGINITNPNITIVGYAWSNGMVGNPINNLTAGAYTVTVTANNGCKEEFTYTVTEPATMGLELAQTNEILCYGDNDGEIQASLTGGTPNYSYAWSNGMSGATISNLGPGAYAVTVTDANGCRTNASITITQPAMLTVVGVPTGTLCAGDNTGRIAAYGTGGTLTTGFLQYSIDGQNWSGGNLFAGLTAGIYNLQVQDQNGCIADTAVVIQDADPFFITSLTADTTIEYLDTMQVFAMVNDTTGVDFTWYDISNGGGLITNSSYDFTIAPEEPITYQFTATNANGCEVDSIVIIEVEKPRRANAPLAFTPNGDGANDYFFIQGDDKVGTVSLFRIYDRWGELVFEGQNLDVNVAEQGWNGVYRGQPSTSGNYTWYADVLFKDGETIQIKGDVTLLR